MPRVSDRHKERRRAEILRAAVQVFNEKGYGRATIDDIARRSGLSVGAIYRYFPSKADIMLALIDRRLNQTPAVFERVTRGIADPWERLLVCIDTFAAALRVRHTENSRLLLVAWSEAVQAGPARAGLHRRHAGLVAYLTGIIREGVATGRFQTDAPAETVATLLLTMADGLALHWVIASPGLDLASLRQTVVDMLRQYLRVRPAGADSSDQGR